MTAPHLHFCTQGRPLSSESGRPPARVIAGRAWRSPGRYARPAALHRPRRANPSSWRLPFRGRPVPMKKRLRTVAHPGRGGRFGGRSEIDLAQWSLRKSWHGLPVTFPVTNEPALAGAGWRGRGPFRGSYAGGRWSALGSLASQAGRRRFECLATWLAISTMRFPGAPWHTTALPPREGQGSRGRHPNS